MRDYWYHFAIMQAGTWTVARYCGMSVTDALNCASTPCIAVALSSERGDVKMGTTFSVETRLSTQVTEVN